MSENSSVLLLIDVGNTRLKWATVLEQTVAVSPVWLASGTLPHSDLAQLNPIIQELPIRRCVVSNVAGEKLQQQLEQILLKSHPTMAIRRFVSSEHCAGLTNLYTQPSRLGSDRFAAAIGAHATVPKEALIVATCGTATTIDAVTPNGTFLGGLILPGLQLMASSLALSTAQLPHIPADSGLQSLFGKNTEQAIISGCIHAQIGAILCAVNELEKSNGPTVQLIISGGAAAYILPELRKHAGITWQHIENLVMRGLYFFAHSENC
ncbi:type III pantothenate kinase [Undibacterium sp. FT137W]|uniref:Type III pantothenate kinase n=2 Tax=Undibacterium fentianense TaxID=2828728 RepID=A0A941E4U7_9BURK|nr:type III pantothenate kinase [Undibacterium fentianense]